MSIIAFWLRGASNNAPLPTDRVKIFKQFQKEKTSKANIREHHTKSIQREWNKKPIMKIYFFCRKFRMLRKRFLKMIFEALWAKLLWDERLTLSKIRTRTCINNHRLDPIGEYSGKYYCSPWEWREILTQKSANFDTLQWKKMQFLPKRVKYCQFFFKKCKSWQFLPNKVQIWTLFHS